MEGYLIFIIIGLIVTGIAAYFLIMALRRYNLILKTETTQIRYIRRGFFEVKGKIVSLSDLLISPYSEKNCVYYNFRVDQKRGSGKQSSWVNMVNDVKTTRFGIDDGTGVAIIDMEGADLVLRTDTNSRSGFFNVADDRQKSVLEKYNQSNRGWFFEKTLRYSETFLEPGDELYLLGETFDADDGMPVFRRTGLPLLVSDKSENELLKKYKTEIIVASSVIIVAWVLMGFFIFNVA
jgi:hypothetical protein